jgi:hypothetical protein
MTSRQAAQDFGKPLWHTLLDDFIVHQAQLLANFCLDICSEFGRRLHFRSLQLQRLPLL